MKTAHEAHLEAVELNKEHLNGDDLLYISKPSPGERTRYVWQSGVKLGLAASVDHFNRLMSGEFSRLPGSVEFTRDES